MSKKTINKRKQSKKLASFEQKFYEMKLQKYTTICSNF